MENLCPLLSKDPDKLSEGEKRILQNILLNTVNFMVKANIVPHPDTFMKWFLTHCYLYSKGIKKPTYDALFNAYDHIDDALSKEEGLTSQKKSEIQQKLNLYKVIIKELYKLIDQLNAIIENAQNRLLEAIGKVLEKDKLSKEEIMEVYETFREVKASLTAEVERIIASIRGIESKVERVKREIASEPVECMKPTVFKAVVRKLIERSRHTASKFSFALVRVDEWENWKDVPKEVKVEYIDKVCSTFKEELRSVDYVSYLPEQEFFAVIIRGIGVKTAYQVMQRILPRLNHLIHRWNGVLLQSSFSIAIVEGRSNDTFGSLIERCKSALLMCPIEKDGCIRTEIDLIGKKL